MVLLLITTNRALDFIKKTQTKQTQKTQRFILILVLINFSSIISKSSEVTSKDRITTQQRDVSLKGLSHKHLF